MERFESTFARWLGVRSAFGFGRKENKTFFTPGPGLGGHCIPIDPFYLAWEAREHDLQMQSVELTPQTLADQDAVLIVTNHSCYDYAWIVANARLVIDTRNACGGVTEGREKGERRKEKVEKGSRSNRGD